MGNGTPLRSALALGLLISVVAGCSKSPSSSSDNTGGSDGGSNSGHTGSSGNGSSAGGDSPTAGSGPISNAGSNTTGFPDDGGIYVGATGDVTTKLPALPAIGNVVARLNDDSTSITFDPFEGALDYRVYELPADSDLSTKADGHIEIKNGTYRCAGNRETAVPTVDAQDPIKSDAQHTQVDNQMVGMFNRKLADATLGYVYTAPGDGLVPVYVLGESDPNADTTCYFARWAASRVKKYTTSKDERDELIKKDYARDDGIAFYVPATAGDDTAQVYVDDDAPGTPYLQRFYFTDGAEAAVRKDKVPAFSIRTKPGPGLLPLMRVFYANQCGQSHDELAVGQERFNRIYKQGDKLPLWSLLWTGITGPTTLVVEALDRQCPYQGHLSPASIASFTALFGTMPLIHEPYMTMAEVRAAAPSGEVFINGQAGPAWVWDGTKLKNGMQPAAPPAAPLPKAVARTFVKVKPLPHPDMDFFADFSPKSMPEAFVDTPCETQEDCSASQRSTSATWDQLWTYIEPNSTTMKPLGAFGQVNGELWVTFGDSGADTNGKFRLTAKQKATMSDAKYLHVTMEADAYSTGRRYPQILISDQDAPVQNRLPKGRTVIVQTRGEIGEEMDWPVDYQIEICKLRGWDVNNQCPVYDLHHIPVPGGPDRLAPNEEVGEYASADQRVIFDVYASTKRLYLFMNNKPYACANMPEGALPTGSVTVTFGDVLYHSGVDHVYEFHANHLQIDTRRHFDNLGFTSGLAEPGWDETRLPCVAPITL
jgi:hypothetical protein